MSDAVMSKTLLRREEVAVEHTWNAESVYANQQEVDDAFKSIIAKVEEAAQYQGHLADSPETLIKWMTLQEEIFSNANRLYMYSYITKASNNEDQAAGALVGRAGGVFGRAIAAVSFTDPELIAIGQETLNQWMKDVPALAEYGHYFDNLFRRQEHVRSAEVEEVLGMLVEPQISVSETGEAITNADLKFRPAVGADGSEQTVAPSTIDAIMQNPDRELRRTAWESYADGFLSLKNTLASNLTSLIKLGVVDARARRYESTLEASLFENNIPTEVYDNLIATYQKNLPTWQRYWRIRRKALGVDALQPYDIWAPLSRQTPEVSYEQGVEWICAGMAPLGERYTSILRKGCLEDRWVDRYPNQGKGQAQFSSGTKGTFPFIMMNYMNTVDSLSTLTHELGHSMHSYHTWENQPFMYANYSLFVAEVASNFNQAMVRAHLLETSDDPEFQIAILEEAMSNFHRYFFIMPTLARFEREMHARIERGEPTSADGLNQLMVDLFSEGYGGEMNIDADRVGITWAQFGHLYAPFYVYQYATGISAANALAKRIRAGEPGAAENYVEFLKAGSSVYPLDALKIAGVDMTSPDPVNEAFEVLSGLVDRLEALTNR